MLFDSETQVGLLKTTLLDYPGRVASMVFFQGCNMHCPFCHNSGFVDPKKRPEDLVSLKDVYNHLLARKNVLTGFVISGGEAILSPEIQELISEVKKINYKVKLDTNGMESEKLLTLINNIKTRPDFIALDVKTSPRKYSTLTNIKDCELRIKKTLEILKEDKFQNVLKGLPEIQLEYRTVLVPKLVTAQDIEEIANIIPKEADWKLAQFRAGNCLDESWNQIEPYTNEELEKLLKIAKSIVPNTSLR